MKKFLLLVTLMICVTGFSQIKEKELFLRMKPTNPTRSIQKPQSFSDMDKQEQERFLQTITKQTQTSESNNSPKRIKQRLDSVLTQTYKEVFTYDNRGLNTLYVSYYWDDYENIWKRSVKYEYEYDAHGNKTLYIYYVADYASGEWFIAYKEETTFDASGNITVKVISYWDNNVLTDKMKREATFDTKGNEIENIRYEWDFVNNDWLKLYRGEAQFDDAGNVTEYIDYEWIGDAWVKYYKVENTYDTKWGVTLSIFYNWVDNTWEYDTKMEYTYDDYGNETLSAYYIWAGTEWMVLFNYKTEYTYDPSGNITIQINYSWDNNDWVPSVKTVYEYDLSGNVTMSADYGWYGSWIGWNKYKYEYSSGNLSYMIEYNWDADNDDWKESYRYEYTYDAAQNIIMTVSYFWENNAWEKSDKNETSYDLSYKRSDLVIPPDFYMDNKMLNEKTYFWDGTDWIESYLTTYYWSEADFEDGISENVPQHSAILIYPNPVSNLLHIETENSDIIPSVKIYSVQGSLLLHAKGNQIDVSALPNGIYIADINGVCMSVVKQ
jgi:hypothetical protein